MLHNCVKKIFGLINILSLYMPHNLIVRGKLYFGKHSDIKYFINNQLMHVNTINRSWL